MVAETPLEELFAAWNAGDRDAIDRIVTELYPSLHSRVQGVLRSEQKRPTQQTTELLHDLYLKLREVRPDPGMSLDHFMNLAVLAVRNLLVDRARRAVAKKRGRRPHLVTLSHAELVIGSGGEPAQLDVVQVHRALERIRAFDEHMANHIELRLFFGLTVTEIVQVFGSNRTKVQREWRLAKRRLLHELRATSPEGETDEEPEGLA
jgi:RNA polymerase sigma factor (TIGR02999 family)